ncbi:regulator of ECF transporter operon [Klebsiella michiganensis]|uniref:Regulator of ECF transporter operon n=1 Tax=Klebsiella michiganensis TaxID=1134687 RepID=A0A7H4M678_9ENTR|nr:regulator of ECF transporter operon [Klebsiella michiganensis]
MTIPHLQPSAARYYALRLLPGDEVFSRLRAFIQEQHIQAAWIAGCTGSLSHAALRFAGQDETTFLTGTYEVISLNGTLEWQGEHLHLAISDPQGAMLGGHMMPAVPSAPPLSW